MEEVFQYGPSLFFPTLTVLWNNPLVQVLFSLVFFVPPTSVSSCWQNLKGDSHCVLSHQSVCVTEYCSEEMRNTSMLCFTSSTSLMVLQLEWRSVLCLGHYFRGFLLPSCCLFPQILSFPFPAQGETHERVTVVLLIDFKSLVFVPTVSTKHPFFFPHSFRSSTKIEGCVKPDPDRMFSELVRAVHQRLRAIVGNSWSAASVESNLGPRDGNAQEPSRNRGASCLLCSGGRPRTCWQRYSPWEAVQLRAPQLQKPVSPGRKLCHSMLVIAASF